MLKSVKCFLLDMDGTLYLGNRLFPWTINFLEKLREMGKTYLFLTNNSSKSVSAYLTKLNALGIQAESKDIVTSGIAAIDYIKRNFKNKRIFLLGTEALAEEFEENGIELDNKKPEAVVTAYDTGLNYERLCRVCALVREGLPYIGTHPDLTCPSENGFVPDLGSFHALIASATGRKPDVIIGKPSPYIMDYALRRANVKPEQAAMIGDRLATDMAGAENAGMTSILVLTGETRREDIDKSGIKPDFIFENIGDIMV